MYCINCGVELADSEKTCPLCGTPVFHPDLKRPDGERPYPAGVPSASPQVHRTGVLFLITVICALPIAVLLLCDWRINGRLVWSGYATGALALGYVLVILPLWFNKPNPVIFIPCDFAAVALYLFYVNYAVGGDWFLPFALPVTGAIGLLLTAVVTLVKYVRRGYLFIFGGASILSGGLMVLVEYLINRTFRLHEVVFWSLFPLTVGLLLGVTLLIIGVSPPLRESLRRKFFL